MTHVPDWSSARMPRGMMPHLAARRLMETMGVPVVDDLNDQLAGAARDWLARTEAIRCRRGDRASTVAVRRALREYDAKHGKPGT